MCVCVYSPGVSIYERHGQKTKGLSGLESRSSNPNRPRERKRAGGRLNLTSILFERLKAGAFEAKYVKQERRRERECVCVCVSVHRLLLKVIVSACGLAKRVLYVRKII